MNAAKVVKEQYNKVVHGKKIVDVQTLTLNSECAGIEKNSKL